jgi:type I restriction enzyme S subunit
MRNVGRPKGWTRVSLETVADIQTGISKSAAKQIADPLRVPYLRVANVQDGFVNLSDVQTIPVQRNLVDRFSLQKNDLLLVEGNGNPAYLGRCAIWDGQLEVCVHQNHLFVVRARETEIDYRYLALQIQSARGRQYLLACSKSSSGLATLNSSQLRSFPLLVPCLVEQQTIVRVFSTWDQAIEQTERLIAAKRRRKQALMQQLLTGRRRFKEFVKSSAVRDTKFGPVPMDWQYLAVGDFASEVSERNADGVDLPVLSCTKYDGLVESLKYFGKRVFSENTTNYKVVRRNQFAYPCNHVEEGSIGVLDFLKAGLVSPIYAVFQTDASVHVPFLYALFKTPLYRHIFEVSTSASVDRRGSLRWKQFAQIRVALPEPEEQKKIAECLVCCDREMDALHGELDALKEQKKGLMQQLLTGKVRIVSRS